MSLTEEITVENLDHLGIVAGLTDEIGIVELINQKLGVDNREKITKYLDKINCIFCTKVFEDFFHCIYLH